MLSKTWCEDKANPKSRAWCFTLANPSFEEIQDIAQKVADPNYELEKIIVGQEIGAGGLQHLQGYLVLAKMTTLWQIKRKINARAHWEVAKAGPQKNYEYCTKQGKILLNKGFDRQKQEESKKDFWAGVVRDAMSMNVAEFVEAHPREWLIRRPQIERLMLDSAKARMRVWNGVLTQKNYWIWGAAGLGKSRWANNLVVAGDTYRKNYNKWWCGFDSRTVQKVVIEDWPGGQQGEILAQHCKIWGDRYPFVGETKGSALMVEPGAFFLIITSNFAPEQCFSRPQDLDAITRRFNIIELTKANRILVNSLQLNLTILTRYDNETEEEEEEKKELEEAREQLECSEIEEEGEMAGQGGEETGEGEDDEW
jgi:hypothetical protein